MKFHRVRVIFEKAYIIHVEAKNVDAALNQVFTMPTRLIEKDGALEWTKATYAEEIKKSLKIPKKLLN